MKWYRGHLLQSVAVMVKKADMHTVHNTGPGRLKALVTSKIVLYFRVYHPSQAKGASLFPYYQPIPVLRVKQSMFMLLIVRTK